MTGQASGSERSQRQASGEGDFPSLCVRAQFTGADDQHPRGVHPVQSHLRVQTEPRDQVLQVSPRLLPPLEEKTDQKRTYETVETVLCTVPLSVFVKQHLTGQEFYKTLRVDHSSDFPCLLLIQTSW